MTSDSVDHLLEDISRINKIPVVARMLETVCKITGLRFAAIARVTKDRWIACSVRDEIAFGLKAGGELKIETTLCNEVMSSREPIVIDHFDEDEQYRDHHTPKIYGLQSYISVPIFLKDGSFFGTLCAIDPAPAKVKNPETIGVFTMFADLIAFHLHSIELMEKSDKTIRQLSRQVMDAKDENQQYRFISNHNLAEPLRKLRLFSNMLQQASEKKDHDKIDDLSLKIGASAQRFSMMLKDITEYSSLGNSDVMIESVDLNTVLRDVCSQLALAIDEKKAVIKSSILPSMVGVQSQLEQLFFQLIFNAIKYSKPDHAPVIRISSRNVKGSQIKGISESERAGDYLQIDFTDNGIGMEKSMLEKIFAIFSKFTYDTTDDGYGIGLAYCRKIVRLHHGSITVTSVVNEGSTFTVTIPVTESDFR